MQQAFNTDME